MKRLLVPVLALVLLPVCTAMANDLEITPFAGYTTRAKLSGDGTTAVGELLVEDSFTAGLGLGLTTQQHLGLEAMWTFQKSALTFEPTVGADQEISDLNVHLVHANFLFYQHRIQAVTEPYFLLGLGAIIFDPSKGALDSETKFTWSIGLGVKHWVNDRMGIRVQARYMPTYISSNTEGYWCDPWYGCYTVGDSNYLDQFDFTGGLCIRLGRM